MPPGGLARWWTVPVPERRLPWWRPDRYVDPEMPRATLVLAAVGFFVAMGFGLLIPVITVFATTFGVTTTAATGVVSAFALARFLATGPAGWLIARIGERGVLAYGLAIVGVTSGLAGLSQEFWQLLVLRGLGGIGSAMFTVAAVSLLLHLAPAHLRGRASAMLQGGFLAGTIIGPGIGGFLAFSLRAPFFFYAIACVAAWFVTVFLVPRVPPEEAEVLADDEPTGAVARVWLALRDRAYLTVLVTQLVIGFYTFGLRTALVPIFVVSALGAPTSLTGLGFVVSAGLSALALPMSGRMTDLRGRRPAILLGTVLTLVGSIVLVVWETEVGFLVAMGVLGVGGSFMGSVLPAIVGDVTGGRRGGPLVATYQAVGDFGSILGPLVGGLLLDLTGSYAIALGSGTVTLVLVLLLALTMPETHGRDGQRGPAADVPPRPLDT